MAHPGTFEIIQKPQNTGLEGNNPVGGKSEISFVWFAIGYPASKKEVAPGGGGPALDREIYTVPLRYNAPTLGPLLGTTGCR